jgi:phage tail sheath protein FI
MARLHPGVYIEEVSSGVRPIEGVSTSNGAFIGKAEMGILNKAVLVTSFQEFQVKYGQFLPGGHYLAHSALQFFNNGGKACYIVRVARSGAAAAAIAIKDRRSSAGKTVTIKAANEGEWGNRIDVVITDGTDNPDNEFAIQVYRDRSDQNPPLPPLLLEINDNLSMNPEADNYVEKALAANSKYILAEVNLTNAANADAGFSRSDQLPVGNGADLLKLRAGGTSGATETPGSDGPPATAGTSRSGVNPPETPPADRRKININLNGDGAQTITIPLEAATGADVAAAIQKSVRALKAKDPVNQSAYDDFTCAYETPPAPASPAYLLTSGTKGATSSVVVTNGTVLDSTEVATPIILPAGQHEFAIEIDGDGPHGVRLTGPLTNGDAIALAIQTAVRALTPKRSSNAVAFKGDGTPANPGFACVYQNANLPGSPSFLLTSGRPAGEARARSSVRVINSPVNNIAGTLKLGVTNGGREVTGAAILRPAKSQTPTEYHLGDAAINGNVDSVTPGADGGIPGDKDYGRPDRQDYINGLPALDPIRDVNIVCIPGVGDAAVVAAGVNYCTQRADCFFVGDVNKTDDTIEEAQAFINSLTVKSSYGAVYFPWLMMLDPSGKTPGPIEVPSSGFVAGMYARIDARRGVWKAPAGTEANIGGAVSLTANITDIQQDFLNPIGVNVIRSFPASGLVIWGSRTLATRSDPEYRYVPVRRTAMFLEQSIYNGIQFAVFEPNDEVLWASLRLNITAFMLLQFRAGAFQGKTANDAFFVKCDSSTTTQADIDAGIVNILVGFAPLKPAEFVVLKLSQKSGQTGA